ncbi:MAG: methionyl-tRNA formyltransferase, partial [Candidatus Pacebacteria bacterium]|nr:methionyl-tRNA formyltransferase [Candidatus Paceibacterota bacterium]
MKIVFIGTPEFGAIILESLIKNGFKPVSVVTSHDKKIGRKQLLTPSPVKKVALKNGIPLLQLNRIEDSSQEIEKLKPDLGIVAAYGQMIPKDILSMPKHGFLNVHPSLLPKYRGSSPIQWPILKGEKETGVTIMLVDEKMDHGPILKQTRLSFGEKETAKILHDILAHLGADLLLKTIPDWINGKIKPVSQNEKEATFSEILK